MIGLLATRMLNVTIKNGVSGREYDARLNVPVTRTEFIQKVQAAMGSDYLQGQIFTVCGKHLDLENDEKFNNEKHNITDGVIIYVIRRIPGGTNVDVSTLNAIILLEIPTELDKLPKVQEECPTCMDSPNYTTICHDKMCVRCFTQQLKEQKLQFKCTICHANKSHEGIFSKQFVRLLQSYHDLIQLLKNVDCQMCRCGFLCYNDSLRPKSDCPNCGRRFCFFCNRDWNSNMNNDSKFTCKLQCVYDNFFSFTLKDFLFGAKSPEGNCLLKIPNQRTCPKCFNLGGYGEKCKYHTCENCKPPYTFCFYCLKSKEDCMSTNHPGLGEGAACALKCREPVLQDHSILPRLLP